MCLTFATRHRNAHQRMLRQMWIINAMPATRVNTPPIIHPLLFLALWQSWLFAFDLHCPNLQLQHNWPPHIHLLAHCINARKKPMPPRIPCPNPRLAPLRIINFRDVTANYTFSIFVRIPGRSSWRRNSFFPSRSVGIQWRKLQINRQKRQPSRCTRPVRIMTP